MRFGERDNLTREELIVGLEPVTDVTVISLFCFDG